MCFAKVLQRLGLGARNVVHCSLKGFRIINTYLLYPWSTATYNGVFTWDTSGRVRIARPLDASDFVLPIGIL